MRASGWLLAARLAGPGLLLLATCAGADIVTDICQHGGTSPSFNGVLQSLRVLQESPRVTVTSAGLSRQGRPMLLVAVRDPAVPVDQTVRIFLIARQHGTEASGTVACLALAKHFARSQGEMERTLLRQLSFFMIPVANPDGMAAGSRGNGGGADLNRNWAGTREPEIKAIKDAVQQVKPHALVDLHELPASSAKPAFRDNFIQTIGRDNRLAADLTTDCTATSSRLASWMGQSGLPVNVYYDTAGESINLCHRYFGLRAGIPSYLFEAKCGANRTLLQRVRFHVLGTLVVANYALHRYYQLECGVDTEPDLAPIPEPAPAAPPPPATVALKQLQPNQVVRGQLPITADVANLPSGGYVSFLVDGRLISLTNTAPHQYVLNTVGYGEGPHAVRVEVSDAAGRTLCSAQTDIVVANGAAR